LIATSKSPVGNNRIPVRDKLPKKWTPTQPRNLEYAASSAEASFTEEPLPSSEPQKVRPRPADAADRVADRDNFRDNQDEIENAVTCTLAYT
jgi:hypothetical protein